MIAPTIGRIVWYWRSGHEGVCFDSAQPMAAKVAFVNPDDRYVNLLVTSHDGSTFPALSVRLVQEGELPPSGAHCVWMPFQIGQAKKAVAEGTGQPAAT